MIYETLMLLYQNLEFYRHLTQSIISTSMALRRIVIEENPGGIYLQKKLQH